MPSRQTLLGGGPEAFVPTDVADIEAWYRADLGVTTSGSDVTAWADQSGNNRDLTSVQSTPQLVSSAVNGRPAVSFDGSNDGIQQASTITTIPQPIHVFAVFKLVTWTSDDHLYDLQNTVGTGPYATQRSVTPNVAQHGGVNIGNEVSPALNTWHLLESIYDGASSKQRLNNDSYTGPTSIGTTGINRISLAMRADAANFADGSIAELIIYSATKTGSDLTSLQNYINGRYGLW